MSEEVLADAIGLIDDDIIEAADSAARSGKKGPSLYKIAALAACIAAVWAVSLVAVRFIDVAAPTASEEAAGAVNADAEKAYGLLADDVYSMGAVPAGASPEVEVGIEETVAPQMVAPCVPAEAVPDAADGKANGFGVAVYETSSAPTAKPETAAAGAAVWDRSSYLLYSDDSLPADAKPISELSVELRGESVIGTNIEYVRFARLSDSDGGLMLSVGFSDSAKPYVKDVIAAFYGEISDRVSITVNGRSAMPTNVYVESFNGGTEYSFVFELDGGASVRACDVTELIFYVK